MPIHRRALLAPTLLALAISLPGAEAEPAPAATPPVATPPTGEPAILTVVGKHETDVYPGSATTANKGKVPNLDSPRLVDTISRDLIRDIDATTATELWRLIPNAIESERGTVIVRGFTLDQRPASGAQLFDGLRTSVYNLVPVNLYNIERVEVMKGPDGVMYGQGQPGGVINFVLKKPEAEQGNEAKLNLDSYGKKLLTLDSTGTMAKTVAGDLLYRINVSGEQSETFRQNEEFKSLRFAPAIAWVASERTRLTLLTEFFKDTRTGGRGYGTPIRQGDIFAMPRDYSIADPNDFRETEGGSAQLQFERQLAPSTKLDADVFFSQCVYWNQYHEGQRNAAEDAANNPVFRRQYRDQRSDTKTWGYDVHLTWDTKSADWEHRVLVGTDFTRIIDPQFPAIDSWVATGDPLNLDNVYDVPAGTGAYVYTSGERTHGTTIEAGAYGNYRIGWNDALFLDVGLRYDDLHQRAWSYNKVTQTNAYDRIQSDAFLAKDAGLVWKLAPLVSVYYGYSSGMHAQGWTEVDKNGGPFDPLQWEQHESGIKAENTDRSVGAHLCAYVLTRTHELMTDPADATRSIDIGKTRSNGIEASLRGRIDSNTSVSATYGFCRAYVHTSTAISTFSGASLEGEILAGVPTHSGNLTLAHSLSDLPVRLTTAFTYVGDRKARNDSKDPLNVELPHYYVIDVGATYIQPSWQVRLGVNNILDRDYAILYRATGHQVNRGDPQTMTASFTTWF